MATQADLDIAIDALKQAQAAQAARVAAAIEKLNATILSLQRTPVDLTGEIAAIRGVISDLNAEAPDAPAATDPALTPAESPA